MELQKPETKTAGDNQGDYQKVPTGSEKTSGCGAMCEITKKCACLFVGIGIGIVIGIGLILGLILGLPKGSSTVETTTQPPVVTDGEGIVSTPTSPHPSTVHVVTQYPGVIIQGSVFTTRNYTAALADPSSAAYQQFERNFTDAVAAFYQPTVYRPFYDDTRISEFLAYGRQVEVRCEIRFTQLDDDNALPDAHTILDDHVRNTHQLGPYFITSATWTLNV